MRIHNDTIFSLKLCLVLSSFVFILSTLLSTANAHSEAEKARFVASSGTDIGTCNNRFRPCKTIAYAAQQANKGDNILVAQGSYRLSNAEELVYLLSDMQVVLGGYNQLDNYAVQAPDKFVSQLIGVPHKFAEQAANKGFKVIVDEKSEPSEALKVSLASVKQMRRSHTQTACTNGESAGFACSNVSILAHLSLSDLPTNSAVANDIWGHVDLNNMREYAIIGLQRGLAVIDVTDPTAPLVVGSVTGQATTWRDIKVLQLYNEEEKRFNAYAYSGGDNINEGITILDLSSLPESLRLVRRSNLDQQSHNVYISNVNYTTNTALNQQTPVLHTTGSENFGGAWRSFSLAEPELIVPSYEPSFASRSDYTHDASSLFIDDNRALSDCNSPIGEGCNVILDFNENDVALWEHSSADNSTTASLLSRASYPNVAYVHSGWWTEDKQHVIVHDELDERNFGLNTTLNIFNINDLRLPTLVGTYTGPTRAIDHNGFVKGNKYYMSNYERGLSILDISDAANPQEIGFFDTFGASNNASFNGAWGVYPFLPSGNILVSDIQGGLYILKDETLNAQTNAVGFNNTLIEAEEGQQVRIAVSKQGTQAMSVDYDILYPSSTSNDVNVVSGTLNWGQSDTQNQFIEFDVLQDSIDELDELLVLTLNNAQGGDIINSASNAFVNIAGTLVNSGVFEFSENTLTVLETDGTVNIDITRLNGTQTTVTINYMLESSSAVLGEDFRLQTGSLVWEEGDSASKRIMLDIINDAISENEEDINIILSSETEGVLGANSVIAITILDDESNAQPQVNAGNDFEVNTRQTVQVAGATASDDGTMLNIAWQQVSGASVNLNAADSINPSFVAPATGGAITLQLTATDEFGVSSSDSVLITVVASQTVPSDDANSRSGGGALGAVAMIFLLIMLCVRRKLLRIPLRKYYGAINIPI